MSGELIRRFMKHKTFGEVYAVEAVMPSGEIVNAAKVDPTCECEHLLKRRAFESDPGMAEMLEQSRKDYEVIDLPCRDASHWLSDIGAAYREREEARIAFQEADATAKSLKKILENKESRVMSLVGDATSPKPLPLFDAKPEAA